MCFCFFGPPLKYLFQRWFWKNIYKIIYGILQCEWLQTLLVLQQLFVILRCYVVLNWNCNMLVWIQIWTDNITHKYSQAMTEMIQESRAEVTKCTSAHTHTSGLQWNVKCYWHFECCRYFWKTVADLSPIFSLSYWYFSLWEMYLGKLKTSYTAVFALWS